MIKDIIKTVNDLDSIEDLQFFSRFLDFLKAETNKKINDKLLGEKNV